MLHFDWLKGRQISWETFYYVIGRLDGLYYMEPDKCDAAIISLTKEKQEEVRNLAEKIGGYYSL